MSEVVYSVSQVNAYISRILENEILLKGISINGEITNASISGNAVYFNIKDAQAMISCVCFDKKCIEIIKNGAQVVVTGSINFYEKGGKLSFIVKSVTPFGEGLLYKQFLELKEKLSKEGLFNAEYKIPIPKYVRRIGVVSSNTGAVIQDIINITTRRNDAVDIVLYPVKVQGIGADEQIVQGINFFSNYDGVDVVIIARGGGSFEDLMPFNTEIVARSAFACKKPLISAVGHETDFTIIDFVADLRAPTPSAAAELCVFEKSAEIEKNKNLLLKAFASIKNRVLSIKKEISNNISDINTLLNNRIMISKQYLTNALTRISNKLENKLNYNIQNLEKNTKLISSLNPDNIIKRGFAKVTINNKIISSIKDVSINDELDIKLKDGNLITIIKEKKNDLWRKNK